MVINNNNKDDLSFRRLDDRPLMTISKRHVEKALGQKLTKNEWVLIKELMLRSTFEIIKDFKKIQEENLFDQAMNSLDEIFKAEERMQNQVVKFEDVTNKMNKNRSLN